MSGKTKQTAQLEPQVTICERSPDTFLLKLESLIAAGYRIDFEQQVTLFLGCHIATVALPEAGAA